MKTNRFLCIIIVSGLLLLTLSQNSMEASEQDKQTKGKPATYELRWGTAPTGGAFQVVGSAMLEDAKKLNPNLLGSTAPSTPTASIVSVHQGKLNIAFSQSDATADAWEGEGYFKPFGKIQDLRNLVTIYPQATHIIVAADSNITKIEDLKGKRISPGAKGLSNDLESQRLFNLYGLSYKDFRVSFLNFEDAAQQFTDGHLDALMFLTIPFPFAPVINVSSKRQIKLLSIPDDKVAALAKLRGIEPYTLPANTYSGINYPAKGIAVRAHIIVRNDFPDDTAYAVVKSIMTNFKRYTTIYKAMDLVKEHEVIRDVGIPFHPGALKYYKERGWIK